MQRKILTLSTALFFIISIWAQPVGYYDAATGLSGEQLQMALHNIIKNHNVQSYSSLWTHFKTSDKKANGKVWDMYSDNPNGTPPYEFTFTSDQCGSYNSEGDCYNREHSWPQSWFNEASPMVSDLFHLYPTDGYVNGKRGNLPFGEVDSPTWTSENGSKVGQCSHPGLSGIVFEPIDEYKGDFARTYFYMAVRYYTEDAGWQSNAMVTGSQIKEGALNMLIEWHIADPVSTKEVNRNNVVYGIQDNRNPFIDRPEFVNQIWGVANQQPTFTSVPVTAAEVGVQYFYEVSATDPENDPLEYVFPFGTNLPVWLITSFVDNGDGTAFLMGTPQADDAGDHNITLTVTDGVTGLVQQSFVISVSDPNAMQRNFVSNNTISVTPNPFKDNAQFKIYLSGESRVKLEIFDICGKPIACLTNNKLGKGEHILNWDGVDGSGKSISNGLYFYRFETETNTFCQKIIFQN